MGLSTAPVSGKRINRVRTSTYGELLVCNTSMEFRYLAESPVNWMRALLIVIFESSLIWLRALLIVLFESSVNRLRALHRVPLFG